MKPISLEVCAGAGGQALGYEMAGLDHAALVEIDAHACETLRLNRPDWNVVEHDLSLLDGKNFRGVDVLCGGLPCPPFSLAGKQLGELDERNLFPDFLRLCDEIQPRAVMVENVRGILGPVFGKYRSTLHEEFLKRGLITEWVLLNASEFGVPQNRSRAIMIGLSASDWEHFRWPIQLLARRVSVGEALLTQMSCRGWEGAQEWANQANDVAPTIVGGSKKHGGPDLGPTRARKAWAELGVDGRGIAELAPEPGFTGQPRLTVEMVATIQGFPSDYRFAGKKTAAYRQVGNALPPPLAAAVANALKDVLQYAPQKKVFAYGS